MGSFLRFNLLKSICFPFLLLLVALHPGIAQAVMADNLTIGNAQALGLGHAVTADPPGIDSIHYNPAGLVRLTGRQAEFKLATGAFNSILEFSDGYTDTWTERLNQAQEGSPADFTFDEARGQTSESKGVAVMLPGQGMTEIPVTLSAMGGASYQPPGSDLTFATNVYAPLMVGFYREDDDPGRYMGRALSFTLLTSLPVWPFRSLIPSRSAQRSHSITPVSVSIWNSASPTWGYNGWKPCVRAVAIKPAADPTACSIFPI